MKLDFKLLPEQKEFVTESNEQAMFVAGYGSGKSHAGTLKTILRKIQYPTKKVAYYLPHYGLVRDIAFDKFPELLDNLGLKYTLNKSDKELHIENYGSIIFRSMDNPDTIVGYETAYSLIDEADILPMDKMEKVYQKILGRNRAIPNAMVDAVSTPEGFKWLYNEAQKGHFKVIRAKTTSNKFLPVDYIDSLKQQYPPNLLKAYLDGEFINLTSGTVYSYFDRNTHHTDRDIHPNDVLHIGQDFNIGGCCGRVHVIDGDIPKLVDEYAVNDTQSIINHLRQTYPAHTIVIYPDASGSASKTNSSKSDIQLLKDAGFTVDAQKKNPRVTDRINAVNTKLYRNEYFVNTHRCPKSTQSLEQQAYDKNGEPEKFGGAATIDDSNDALGYFIVRKFGLIRNSIKQVGLSYE